MNKKRACRSLGDRINNLRKMQKLTVRGFALMVGLNKNYLIDLEKGRKSASCKTLMKLCAGFGITPSELLEGIGNA